MALLMGSKKTTTQAYTSPGMDAPAPAAAPGDGGGEVIL